MINHIEKLFFTCFLLTPVKRIQEYSLFTRTMYKIDVDDVKFIADHAVECNVQTKTIYTANSIKVDIENSQMCIMIDRVPKQ